MKKLERSSFTALKRERLLNYENYVFNFDVSALETFSIVHQGLTQPADLLANVPPSAFMESTQERAWQALHHLMNCYSAGHDILELRSFYISALEYWEEYARYSALFDQSDEGSDNSSGHIPLADTTYICALHLICFGILLGWEKQLYRIVPILDYRNPRDGLLDRLLMMYGEDRGEPSAECVRHLPYFKTLKIFSATTEQKPGLVAEYLQDWYLASRREEYYDSHKRGNAFKGYWSLEAAAITIALDIDDSIYRSAEFYPCDLVDFARNAKRDYAPVGAPQVEGNELRTKANDPCPKSGLWQSLDVPPKTKRYEIEQPMADLGSAYGLTVWKFVEQ